MSITVAQNAKQYGGNPPRKTFGFPSNLREAYMKKHSKCQHCIFHKSTDCAHIVSGDPNSSRYDGKYHVKTITGE